MPGMLFVVGVPAADTERALRQDLRAAAAAREVADPPPLEKMLLELLKRLQVERAVWSLDKAGQYYQVLFVTGSGDPCENCLHCLSQLGIGKKLNSSVSVAPCNVYLQGVSGDSEAGDDEDESEMAKRWNNFVQSIRSKLTVKQVVDGVRSGAECSFDYMTLVLTAEPRTGFYFSMIAAVGLVENNSVNIVAAMLVSPLMGPIMAVTFGVIIAEWKLVKIGIRSEAVGMLISLVFGFIFGLLVGAACNHYPWGFGDWPTPEMKGRGNYRSLWIGILWALPSGTGVALALLQGSAGPLIGVAISASLLPPIVNCGIMWGMAAIHCMHDGMKFPYVEGELLNATSSNYQPIYSHYVPAEFAAMGIVSLCLTLINFCCIFITAVIVLKIKEVAAPYVSPPDLRRFWEHDLRVTRDANRSTLRRSRRASSRRGPGPASGCLDSPRRDPDKELRRDIGDIPEEELGPTLEAAVREAMDDVTFRRVKRCSYSRGSTDLVHALGLAPAGRAAAAASVDASPLSDPLAADQLLRTLLGHQQAQQGPGPGPGQRGNRLRPLSRSLRLGSARSRNSLMRHAGTPPSASARNSALPTILEAAARAGKRGSLTERALAASRHVLQSLATPPRCSPRASSRSRPPAPPGDSGAARFERRRGSETVSLTRDHEQEQEQEP